MNNNNNSNSNNNNSRKYKVLAESNGSYLVTRNLNATFNDIMVSGFIVNKNGKIISPELPIGTLTKDGYWHIINGNYEDLISSTNDYIRDALLGAAVGDAYGVPYEFLSRAEISKLELGDMIGNDNNPGFVSRWSKAIPSGAWSDDTSMIVATMEAICANRSINYDSIMNNYLRWWNEGKYSSLEFPFGLGGVVNKSLVRYANGVSPTECGGRDFMDNGNGSLMRILPFSIYCIENDLDDNETLDFITKASSLTHGNEISIMACFMYTIFLKELVRTRNKNMAFSAMIFTKYENYFSKETVERFKRINNPNFYLKIEDINESGYVIDTLETVMYAIMNSNSYRETIENCIKVGYDTDTSACIAGSLAGVLYGYENIPKEWLAKLRRREYLEGLSEKYSRTLETMKLSEKRI